MCLKVLYILLRIFFSLWPGRFSGISAGPVYPGENWCLCATVRNCSNLFSSSVGRRRWGCLESRRSRTRGAQGVCNSFYLSSLYHSHSHFSIWSGSPGGSGWHRRDEEADSIAWLAGDVIDDHKVARGEWTARFSWTHCIDQMSCVLVFVYWAIAWCDQSSITQHIIFTKTQSLII